MRPSRLIRRASVLGSLALVAAAPSHPWSRETVDIGVEDAAAPWSQADGTGYANDVVRAAFDAVGVDVRMRVLPYARCKQQVVNGELVACVSMSPAPELKNVVRFSARPLFVFTCQFFERADEPPIHRIRELAPGARVGTVLGYEYPPELLTELHRLGAVLDAGPTEETNLRKLAVGRLDASIVNRDEVKSASWVVSKAGVSGKVRPTFSIGALPAYIGFSLARADGAALARRFDVGHSRIIASGLRDRIAQRWIARGPPQTTTR